MAHNNLTSQEEQQIKDTLKMFFSLEEGTVFHQSFERDVSYGNIFKPLDIIKFLSDHGFEVISTPFLLSEGKCIYRKKKILINSKIKDKEHARFVVCHELAHYIDNCVHSKGVDSGQIKFTYRRNRHNSLKERSRYEQKMDYMASMLLMPENAVKKEFERLLSQSDDLLISINDIVRELSLLFEVEPIAMLNRLKELEIVVQA